MGQQRRRIKHEKTFQERLAEEAERFKEAADGLPPGTQRELYLRRARQAETAAHIDDWLSSPGLQPRQGAGELGGQVMRDHQASPERLRTDAAEAALIRDLATDQAKREMFDRLHRHLSQLANEVERVMRSGQPA